MQPNYQSPGGNQIPLYVPPNISTIHNTSQVAPLQSNLGSSLKFQSPVLINSSISPVQFGSTLPSTNPYQMSHVVQDYPFGGYKKYGEYRYTVDALPQSSAQFYQPETIFISGQG